jgi:hypothetical protein
LVVDIGRSAKMEKLGDLRDVEDRQRNKQPKKAKNADVKRALAAARKDEWAEEEATILAKTNHDRTVEICRTDALVARRHPRS